MDVHNLRLVLLVLCYTGILAGSLITLCRRRTVMSWVQVSGAFVWVLICGVGLFLQLTWPDTTSASLERTRQMQGWWKCEYYILHPLAALLFTSGLLANALHLARRAPGRPDTGAAHT